MTGSSFAITLITASTYLIGCRTPESVDPDSSEIYDDETSNNSGFALIGCNSEAGWKITDQVNCQQPYRLCYVGPRKNVIEKINQTDVKVEEEIGLKSARNGGGISIRSEVWDLPNNIKSREISFSSCKQEIRISVVESARKQPTSESPVTGNSGVMCKHEDSNWYSLGDESDACSDQLELCYEGTQGQIIRSVNQGISVSDEFEIRSAKLVSASELRVSLWDLPNNTYVDSINVKQCQLPAINTTQQKKIAKLVLQNIDNLCGNTMCAGDFTYQFKGMKCDFSKSQQCTMKYSISYHDEELLKKVDMGTKQKTFIWKVKSRANLKSADAECSILNMKNVAQFANCNDDFSICSINESAWEALVACTSKVESTL